jgi:hypothetical protein
MRSDGFRQNGGLFHNLEVACPGTRQVAVHLVTTPWVKKRGQPATDRGK